MVGEAYITTWMNIAGPFFIIEWQWYLWQFKRIPTAWDHTWMNTAGLSFLSLSKISMTIQAYTHSVGSHMDEHC